MFGLHEALYRDGSLHRHCQSCCLSGCIRDLRSLRCCHTCIAVQSDVIELGAFGNVRICILVDDVVAVSMVRLWNRRNVYVCFMVDVVVAVTSRLLVSVILEFSGKCADRLISFRWYLAAPCWSGLSPYRRWAGLALKKCLNSGGLGSIRIREKRNGPSFHALTGAVSLHRARRIGTIL